MEQLLAVLKTFANENVEYVVREVNTHQIESYNIKQESEMNRNVDARHIFLTLYVVFEEDGKKYRGSYSTEIHPSATEAEIKKAVADGVFAAGFVKNEYYPLVSPENDAAELTQPSNLAGRDLYQALQQMKDAFYVNDNHADGNISYSEFFITKEDIRIVNSLGVDVSYTSYAVYVETAVHWRGETGETEITEAYRFNNCDTALLTENVQKLFTVAEKKSTAKKTPMAGDINILLSGECLATFFGYYHECADAQYVYQQFSTFKEGEDVQGGGDAAGDKITMLLDPDMPGSTFSRPYDNDGKRLSQNTIIENGKLLKYWGNTRFSSYLNTTPTGDISNFVITGGTHKAESLYKEPYIELVSFSDFQANPITGDFGSEIRLGFYYDGEKTIPITGGSISGNMRDVQAGMKMSTEQKQYNNYKGPSVICIRGASIAGCE